MSSRTENDDPWRRHASRTAAGGPRHVLPAATNSGPGGMTGGGPMQEPPPLQERDGWRILSYLLGGMILYGGIGWFIGEWTGSSALFPIGMLLGLGLAVAMIIFRFTRS